MKLRDLEDWLTTGQAAKELGITRQRVLAMVADGRLRAVLVGRNQREHGRATWIFDPASIERHKADRTGGER